MTKAKQQFPHLLAPGKIGSLELKNRVVMGPTETLYATSDGEITDKIIDYGHYANCLRLRWLCGGTPTDKGSLRYRKME